MRDQPTLSETLYTAADLQGKASACTSGELRELGDEARRLENAHEALVEALQNIVDAVVEEKGFDINTGTPVHKARRGASAVLAKVKK